MDRIPPVKKCLSYKSVHGFTFRPPADEHREKNISDVKNAIEEARDNELVQKMNKLGGDIATWMEGPAPIDNSGRTWKVKKKNCSCQSTKALACKNSKEYRLYCLGN